METLRENPLLKQIDFKEIENKLKAVVEKEKPYLPNKVVIKNSYETQAEIQNQMNLNVEEIDQNTWIHGRGSCPSRVLCFYFLINHLLQSTLNVHRIFGINLKFLKHMFQKMRRIISGRSL